MGKKMFAVLVILMSDQTILATVMLAIKTQGIA